MTPTPHWLDSALQLANIEYYEATLAEEMKRKKVKDEGTLQLSFVKVGDYAECSNCHAMKVVSYMYGGVNPLCVSCAKEILD